MVVDFDELQRLGLVEGDLQSLVELSDHYYKDGDYEKAFKCAYRASLRSYPTAERKLGFYYEKGIGVEKNYEKAFSYYSNAYAHHDLMSAYNLSLLLSQGLGCEKDLNKAFELATVAYSTRDSKAIK